MNTHPVGSSLPGHDSFEVAFWAAANHPSFVQRFRGREHPLLPDNSAESYRPERLLARIQELETQLTQHMHPRNRWVLSNRLGVLRSWLRQSIFILSTIGY